MESSVRTAEAVRVDRDQLAGKRFTCPRVATINADPDWAFVSSLAHPVSQ